MYFVMYKGFFWSRNRVSLERAASSVAGDSSAVRSTAVGYSMILAILQPSKGQRDRQYAYNVAYWRVRVTVQVRKHDCVTSAIKFHLVPQPCILLSIVDLFSHSPFRVVILQC
jgi:hypothetical protein